MADAVDSCWCYDGGPRHGARLRTDATGRSYGEEGAGTGEGDHGGSEVSNGGVSALPANRTAGSAPDSPDGCTGGLQIALLINVFCKFASFCCCFISQRS